MFIHGTASCWYHLRAVPDRGSWGAHMVLGAIVNALQASCHCCLPEGQAGRAWHAWGLWKNPEAFGRFLSSTSGFRKLKVLLKGLQKLQNAFKDLWMLYKALENPSEWGGAVLGGSILQIGPGMWLYCLPHTKNWQKFWWLCCNLTFFTLVLLQSTSEPVLFQNLIACGKSFSSHTTVHLSYQEQWYESWKTERKAPWAGQSMTLNQMCLSSHLCQTYYWPYL